MGVPEVFYGTNHLYIVKPDRDFLFEVSPVDALSLSAFAKRTNYLKSHEASLDNIAGLSVTDIDPERSLNLIDMIPKNIEVK